MLPKDPTKVEAYRKLRSQQAIARGFGKMAGQYNKGKTRDITGQIFGMLTAVKFIEFRGDSVAYWLFKCKCGKEHIAPSSKIVHGKVKSCGCLISSTQKNLKTIHGMANHSNNNNKISIKFYGAWSGLKSRCTNLKDPAYKRYGGRNIKVCKEWRSFLNFKKDMYDSFIKHINKYGPKNTSIDRVNVNGNYEPSNCRWATMKEQNNNRTDYSEKSSIAQKERFKHEVPWNKGLKVFKPSDPNKSITKPCLWCGKDFTSFKCHKRKCCCKSCSAKYVGKRDGAWNKGLSMKKRV
jgi:hypothetical protein